ncbi:cysteine proteinase [Auriculariales sp. MPI-PUGE-AT-0066]|nr:cysteine proteinase [Auriculariales sp. MPI-PUGE-AT-0066]
MQHLYYSRPNAYTASSTPNHLAYAQRHTPMRLNSYDHYYARNAQRRRPIATTAAPATTQEPALAGATDPELSKLSRAQLLELNQKMLEETGMEANVRQLISPVLPMSELRNEYGGGVFVRRIDWLVSQGYTAFRRSRGDGDCMFRSIAFAFVEKVLNAPDITLAVASAVSTLESTLPMLKAAGFEPLVYEDFYDIFRSLIDQIVRPDSATRERLDANLLLEAFQEPEVSNSAVVYLRLLTSAQIRTDEDNYSAFLFHPETGEQIGVREFCEAFVEPTGKESDHVQMTAISRALKINVRIAYLDGSGAGDSVEFVEFENRAEVVPSERGGFKAIELLYRPGHYDILERL